MGTESRAHEFSDVDRTGRAAEFVHYLDERGSLEFMQLLSPRFPGQADDGIHAAIRAA